MVFSIVAIFIISFSYKWICKGLKPRSMGMHKVFSSTDRNAFLEKSGLLHYISQIGNERMLLATEYDLAFRTFDKLKLSASKEAWPNRRLGAIERTLVTNKLSMEPVSVADIERSLSTFRKVILGVEKYRINNPYRIASKYSEFITSCLRLPEYWGAAANAIEYAGLNFRDFIYTDEEISYLSLNALWNTALDKLLDIKLAIESSGAAATTSGSTTDTWDQKYFSQIEDVADEKILDIRDFLLALTRIAGRVILSKDQNSQIPSNLILSLPGNEEDMKNLNNGEFKSRCHRCARICKYFSRSRIFDRNLGYIYCCPNNITSLPHGII